MVVSIGGPLIGLAARGNTHRIARVDEGLAAGDHVTDHRALDRLVAAPPLCAFVSYWMPDDSCGLRNLRLVARGTESGLMV